MKERTVHMFVVSVVNNLKDLKGHILRLHKEKHIKCTHCSKAVASQKGPEIHMRNHTNENPFKCNVCQKAFSRSASLGVHKIIHTRTSELPCSQCDRKFSSKTRLDAHQRKHEPYICYVCKKSFETTDQRSRHISRVHNRAYTCSYCGETYAAQKEVETHEMTHTGEKPFACDI